MPFNPVPASFADLTLSPFFPVYLFFLFVTWGAGYGAYSTRHVGTVFSLTEEAQTFCWGKGGHCEYLGFQTHYSMGTRDVKQPKPTYCIKTKRELSRQESLKAHLKKPRCLVKDSLHGGPSRISSPLVGHLIVYGMFIMNNTKNIFIHRFPSF